MRPLLALVCSAVLAITACGEPPDGQAPAASTRISIQPTDSGPPLPFAAGDTLQLEDATVRLQKTALAAITGGNSASVVHDETESRFIYAAFEYYQDFDFEKSWSHYGLGPGDAIGRPMLRLVDLDAGTDVEYVAGAESVAWARDGRIAYLQGDPPEYVLGADFQGRVMVRPTLTAPAVPWVSEPARYTVLAWAQHRLLFSQRMTAESGDLLVADGPEIVRRLATNASFLALSPDGSKVAIIEAAAEEPTIKIVDIATGVVEASLGSSEVEAAIDGPLQYLEGNGSWVEDRIALMTQDGAVVLRYAPRALTVETHVELPQPMRLWGPHEPRLTEDGSTLVAWAALPGTGGEAKGRLYMYAACQVSTGRCRSGPVSGEQTFYAVTNPSRP